MKELTTESKKNELIDMLTRFYVHIIRSDEEIKKNEIDILYPLLLNLFKSLPISWEVYIKEIMNEEYDLVNVINFLNRNLNQLDKIRVIITLIIMAFSDSDFEMYEISSIQSMMKYFKIDGSGFMDLMRNLELKTTAPLRITDISSIFQFENSLFTDYLVVGKSERCNLRFKDPTLANIELVMFGIDANYFLIAGPKPSVKLNGNELRANHIYYLPQQCKIEIQKLKFNTKFVDKLMQNMDNCDVINFTKADYDFKISCEGNQFYINVRRGYVYKNGKSVSYNRDLPILWDDNLRIKGYAAFSLIDVLDEKERIGIDDLAPDVLYLNLDNGFYSLVKHSSDKAIAQIENRNNSYHFIPLKKNYQFLINGEDFLNEKIIQLNEDIITIEVLKGAHLAVDKSAQNSEKALGKQLKNKVKQQLRNRDSFNFRINNFFDLVEVPFEINNLEVTAIKHYHKDKTIGLDNISFNAKQGELIGILGPSGCGKSTLLKTLVAEFQPTHGKIEVDGKSLYKNRSEFMQYFGYVPQEDMIFANLTVFENMYFYGRLRMPNVPQNQLISKIDNILNQVTLAHKRNTLVGNDSNKILSGGQRKRLNIALELLFEPIVLVCDEPTSGLSSFDAEQIIELLHEQRRQNRIVIITAHQPNAYIFKKFSKVLLMDNGGKEVFFGSPTQAFSYFQEELEVIKFRKSLLDQKVKDANPDFFYDIILFPEYDVRGNIKFEQINQQVVTKRKFSSEYWRDKYKRKILFQLITKEDSDERVQVEKKKIKYRKKLSYYARLVQFSTYLHRNLVNKLRNKTNLMITFLEAPLLALVVAYILRLTPTSDKYSFYENPNITLYLFVSIIIFIFFGMTNSIHEILEERKFILREKVRNLKISHYHISKFLVLGIFTVVQALLFHLISSSILEIRGFFFLNVLYFSLSGLIGLSIGLLFSSFINDTKGVINILPLILIPQIIFGGAVIQFDKMNRNLTIMKKNPIPEVVQTIPSRWLFEGLVTGYSTENVNNKEFEKIDKKILTLEKTSVLSKTELRDEKYELIEEMNIRFPKRKFTNQDINLIVDMMYGRFKNRSMNVFISPRKKFWGVEVKTVNVNIVIVLTYIMLINLLLAIRLKYYYNE
ncbi:ATP-binding cassette domain-containing protein [bacterium]|nr:ATP-binding cassette domain-containing protein [bacterium]